MAGPKSRTRPPSVRSPGALPGSLILARLRGRSGAAGPRPPRPLPSGPRPPPAPPANFPLPASCPASPFPRPGAAPHGHKGRAAGQERRDAAWNAAPEPDKVVGGGGGNRRLAGAKMLWRSVLTVGHDCPIPLSGEKLTWNRPFFKPGVYVCLRVFSCPQREEEMGGRQTPARRSPLQACQPCNLLLTKSYIQPVVSVTPKALPFQKVFLVQECVCTYLGEEGARTTCPRKRGVADPTTAPSSTA